VGAVNNACTSNTLTLTVVGPSLSLNQTSITAQGPVQVTFANGRGMTGEWIGLFPTSATGAGGYVDWLYTNGTQSPGGAPTGGTLTFPTGGRVLSPGTYVFGWISGGAVIATSPVLTVVP
jgi:hypothetical protein